MSRTIFSINFPLAVSPLTKSDSSPGDDIGSKLLYAMAHAEQILSSLLPSFYLIDLLVGSGIAAVLKILVWQKQADAKKLRKGVEYGSARWSA